MPAGALSKGKFDDPTNILEFSDAKKSSKKSSKKQAAALDGKHGKIKQSGHAKRESKVLNCQ